jgi:hypothetical protein
MFTTINYLFHEKNKSELDSELIQNFNPYITRKAFSFYDSGKYCNYINETLNTYSGIFESKENEFQFFDSIIPKLKRRKSEYIKKTKKDKPKKELPISEFLSKRELAIYESINKYDYE